ncbi:MAG: N-6 DNA methylase [Tissierellia bacterium]|nr:N-6 DNA methylase [Tissierellia bacterium]
MDKSLISDIKCIINEIEGFDYISKVKYVILLVCNELYNLNNEYPMNSTTIFKEYAKFDLEDIKTEKRIAKLVEENADNIEISSFYPASLYEALLTDKEKKSLGQVYTPFEIINNMLHEVFKVKSIDENTKILDPSCGGGYFLVEIYKYIRCTHAEIHKRHIIENMLFGIDIDDFSIFLSKMGLIFHSGLYDIKFNIYNYDFLIDNLNMGKFDIIIGNPPYVGHKNSTGNYKKLLYEKYSDVYYDKADISYCFFRKGKDLLKLKGIISFITSRYFMEALYADKLRSFLKENYKIVTLIDYNGDTAFKRAMISPAVIILSNTWNKNMFTYVKKDRDIFEAYYYKQDKLKDSGWIVLKDEDEKLFEKIDSISNTYIKDICSIKQGIITGCDKAFIVTEEVIEKYKIESFLLRKWIKNSNISKKSIKYNNLYLIYSDIIQNENDCPNAISYLSIYKDKLMSRRECKKGFRKWYELQWGRIKSDYENPKIIFPYKSKQNNFYYDEQAYFCSADIYLMNQLSKGLSLNYLLSYLNSEIFEFYLKCQLKKVGRNNYEYYPYKLNNLKVYLPQKNFAECFSNIENISIELFMKKLFNISEKEVNIIKNYL